MLTESVLRDPLIVGDTNYTIITDEICSPAEQPPTKHWLVGFALSTLVLGFGIFCFGWEVVHGIGSWGLNKTIGIHTKFSFKIKR
jgi:molybdopterin-containing oxidoreductase family membrane subunit